ncbi:uridine diphosphate glucose pyrophosphatase NUDT22-like [Patiria miniata]|uniref:Nudix hydrolase domain-containing protein n=1 Tax=Patiria miniata TaxID=46514 RepID=A0A914BEF3_PATMI|nr:uridine diphosphate glucose pyrophosphatase NUDT22-like [Patiria miniata]
MNECILFIINFFFTLQAATSNSMDGEFSLLFAAPNFPGVPQSNLHVRLSEDYNRKSLPSNEINIDRIWELRRKSNPRLYNGSKFRFHAIEVDSNGGDCSSCSAGVTFHLGITGYKNFMGTNWADNATELLESGVKDFANSQAYMSDALGVGSLVHTADECVVLIRRSSSVGEAQGLWDIPGGHPEPGEVKGGSSKMEDITLSDISELDVSKELVDSAMREIRDEINIPKSKLEEPHLMGVTRNHTSSGRPNMQFFVRCTLPSSEVRQMYRAGGAEAEESTALKLIQLSDIFYLESTDMWKEMAPAAKACVKLYTTLRNNLSDSENNIT